jgi:RNA polymerase sigma-70 factor, ECF subfamily
MTGMHATGATDAGVPRAAGARAVDAETAAWLRTLRAGEPTGYGLLHERLLRIARGELRRRAAPMRIAGPELDDVAHQAAADALVSIRRRLPEFRCESRFTTWAHRFVALEVGAKLGRHPWSTPSAQLAASEWDRLPDRFGRDPERESEGRELVDALRRAVDEVLTEHQRRAFVAVVLDGVPLDAVAGELGASRNAVYKTVYDARRKLRARLVAEGHLL